MILTGTQGNDTLVDNEDNGEIRGLGGDDVMTGGAGNDYIDGGDGHDTATYLGYRSNFEVSRDASGVVTISDMMDIEGEDQLTSVEAFYFAEEDATYTLDDLLGYFGTEGNDTIVAGDVDSQIYGLGGNDTLTGGGGWNWLDGGEGVDTACYAGSSSDYEIYRWFDGTAAVFDNRRDPLASDEMVNVEFLYFAGDNVTIAVADLPAFGTSGDDTLNGSIHNDNLWGGEGNDTLYGLGGDDGLDGFAGNDFYYGGAGDDHMGDYEGNDTYHYGVGDGSDAISDGDGYDILIFGAGIAASEVSVSVFGEAVPGQSSVIYILSLAGSGDTIELWDYDSGEQSAIEEVRFADGTVWDGQDLYDRAHTPPAAPFVPGPESESYAPAAFPQPVELVIV